MNINTKKLILFIIIQLIKLELFISEMAQWVLLKNIVYLKNKPRKCLMDFLKHTKSNIVLIFGCFKNFIQVINFNTKYQDNSLVYHAIDPDG